MQTPFDAYILKLWDKQLWKIKSNLPISNTVQLVFSFAKICRVLYMQMLLSSLAMQNTLHANFEENKHKPSPRNLTIQETLEMGDDSTFCILNYFQFLEHINVYGRAINEKCHSLPPLYNRIYFYRNKMIEHWDDYVHLLMGAGTSNGIKWTNGKICIPYHYAGIFKLTEAPAIMQKLEQNFASKGVTLPSLVDKHYGEYSELIYTALMQIDPELRSKNIPENIIENLFKYSFPTPINDIEDYCKSLVVWIEKLSYNI